MLGILKTVFVTLLFGLVIKLMLPIALLGLVVGVLAVCTLGD